MIDITEIKSRLDSVETMAEKVKLLDEQAAVLSTEADAARKRVRVAYRDLYATKFEAFDAKAALVGATVTHTITIGPAQFRIAPPSAGLQRTVEAYAGVLAAAAAPGAKKEAIPVTPILTYEGVLLAWLHSVQLTGQSEQKVADMPVEARLTHLRRLPDVTVSKLAAECQLLESWLSATMEIDLGN